MARLRREHIDELRLPENLANGFSGSVENKMTQKFKFGDMVKSREYIALSNKSLFFFRYSDEESDLAECLEQDGTFHFLKVEDLELILHPDTARLDWLEKNQFELGTYYDDDELGFIDLRYVVYQPDKQGCRIKLSDEKSYRQAIDRAM